LHPEVLCNAVDAEKKKENADKKCFHNGFALIAMFYL